MHFVKLVLIVTSSVPFFLALGINTEFSGFFLIYFAQTKINLSIFFKSWLNKGKIRFSSSGPVFL